MGIDYLKGDGFLATNLNRAVGWARKYSLWPMPFATACCGIEYMAFMASHYDIARFGAERPSFSPRQADLLIVIGTVCIKMAPVLKRIYDQMAEPKWVIAMGACASCGGMFDVYSVIQGMDELFPVDMYIPGCPPRPEMLMQGFIQLQEKVQKEGYISASMKHRLLKGDN
ncbi:MAG: NADH-quinone oxidoreductase subunit B [bacterium]|nr:NADH-quinone oxidoreductase subunit B [bacterium]